MNYSIVRYIKDIQNKSCIELRHYNRDSDNIQTGLIVLPKHITHLKLLRSDYTILKLPDNLISLEIEDPINFNKKINLPKKLEYLTMPHNYIFNLPYNNLNNIKLISHIKNTQFSIDEVLNDESINKEKYIDYNILDTR